jgi:hypothetical protein
MSIDRKRIDAVRYLEEQGYIYKDFKWHNSKGDSSESQVSPPTSLSVGDSFQSKYLKVLSMVSDVYLYVGKSPNNAFAIIIYKKLEDILKI